jgi:UDP-4-amino-4,6-dideoxy-N-acetyl-beta-L-altrosamine transaminase
LPAPFLPYGRQVIDAEDREAVARVLDSPLLTTGPFVEAFEAAIAAATGAAEAVVCSSGTAALHLAALALSLRHGDTVIVPAVTFAGTANAPHHAGAEIVFADVDPETGLLTPETLEAALQGTAGRRFRAVFPVHLAGQCVDMAGIGGIAGRHGLRVVEDAAHAIGSRARHDDAWIATGGCRHSDLAIFSFHPVKTITTGEGGAITTNDTVLASRLRLLRNHGIVRQPERFDHCDLGFAADGSPNPWYYEISEIGFNYRLTDLQCALGLSQIAKLDRFVARRAALVECYRTALKPLAPLVRPLRAVADCRPGWHLFVVLMDFRTAGIERAAVMRQLAERGIGSQVHYMPLYLHPYYRNRYGAQSFPGAESYYDRALSLPLFADMTEADVGRVVAALHEVVGTRQ